MRLVLSMWSRMLVIFSPLPGFAGRGVGGEGRSARGFATPPSPRPSPPAKPGRGRQKGKLQPR